MFDYKYLSPEHLKGFDNYKYNAVDNSPLSVYVMHPFWNRVVELVPLWVAPNLLTFVGFLFTVFDFALLSWYDYDFYAASSVQPSSENTTGLPIEMREGAQSPSSVPGWCWIALAVFLFLAYTLDGIDGKQARRTGTSGPLGELFDHGLDSFSVSLIPICLYSVFGRADYSIPPIRMYFVLWNIMFNFYASHWEKYLTKVLYLPWGYDFSMWGGCGVFLVAGLYGTGVFKVTAMAGLTAANLFEIAIYATGLLTNIPVSIYNVYLSYANKTGAMRSAWEALRPAVSPVVMATVTTAWALSSPGDIAERSPRLLWLMCGVLFSNLTCRLIVAQMSGQRCPAVCWLVSAPAAAALLSHCCPAAEVPLLYAVTTLSLFAHVHYGACVVRQMCEHFGIGCFYIKRKTN